LVVRHKETGAHVCVFMVEMKMKSQSSMRRKIRIMTVYAFVVSNLYLFLLLLLPVCNNSLSSGSGGGSSTGIWNSPSLMVDAFALTTTTTTSSHRSRQRSTPITTATTLFSGESSFSAAINNTEDSTEDGQREPQRIAFIKTAVPGPSLDTKPDYENIVGPLGRFVDNIFQQVFRDELAQQVMGDGYDDDDDDNNNNNNHVHGDNPTIPNGYAGIVELAARMNQEFAYNRTEIHVRAQTVLRNLFPSWMPVRIIIYNLHHLFLSFSEDGVEPSFPVW